MYDFNSKDVDGNGDITVEELATVLRAMGTAASEAQLQEFVQSIDMDGDGNISFEEFIEIMVGFKVESDVDAELREAFKIFDEDNSGEITIDELKMVMRKIDATLSEAEVGIRFIASYLNEFVAFITNSIRVLILDLRFDSRD